MAHHDKAKEKDKAAQPNPLATNPLHTIDIRWQKSTKSLHTGPKPTGTFLDVKPVNGVGQHLPSIPRLVTDILRHDMSHLVLAACYSAHAVEAH